MKLCLCIFPLTLFCYAQDMTWQRTEGSIFAASVSTASRPVFVENNTNIFVGPDGAAINTAVICSNGAVMAWTNSGTNEIEWSTNGIGWNPSNVRWAKSQVVNYYVVPSNQTVFYRRVPR